MACENKIRKLCKKNFIVEFSWIAGQQLTGYLLTFLAFKKKKIISKVQFKVYFCWVWFMIIVEEVFCYAAQIAVYRFFFKPYIFIIINKYKIKEIALECRAAG